MNTATNVEPRIETIRVTSDEIIAALLDGRTVSVPLAWSWRLSDATPEQRARFEIIGRGQGIHWPDLDEDLSADGMLNGTPARGRAATSPRRLSSTPASPGPRRS